MPTDLAQLAHLARLADSVTDDAERLVEGLTDAQLLWRPAPARWGVADCFAHLVMLGALYYPGVRAALDRAPRRDRAAAAPPYRRTVLGRLMIRLMGPRARLRVPTSTRLVPPAGDPAAPVRFVAQQALLRQLIDDAGTRDLRGLHVRSPLRRAVSLRVVETLELLVVHERRHLVQACRVMEEPEFPPG